MNLTYFEPSDAPHDEATKQQLRNCVEAGDGVAGVLCADAHLGYSQPIGGAVAYADKISPSGVGYDIGCGNKAVATSLLYSDISKDLPRIMDEITRRISFGVGQSASEQAEDPVLDEIKAYDYRPISALHGLAAKQLGTVGAGNHYVDLFREEGTDRVWIGVHFGSRGFGHKIASGFLSLAEGGDFDGRASEGEMMSPPVLFDHDEWLGYAYISAMKLAGNYAYAGRNAVCRKVLEILGNPGIFKQVHNHHNFAWWEPTKWGDAWVIRKGCTPLWPGQEGFVGASMGEQSVILLGAPQNSQDALWSAPHGAGRAMSRTEAKGKSKKRWYCRNCGWEQAFGVSAPEGHCPSCHSASLGKHWVQMQPGKIDWAEVRRGLKTKNIELRGGAADEAPGAYKRLPAVLAAHGDQLEITHRLNPIGVAMASDGTYDPYKD